MSGVSSLLSFLIFWANSEIRKACALPLELLGLRQGEGDGGEMYWLCTDLASHECINRDFFFFFSLTPTEEHILRYLTAYGISVFQNQILTISSYACRSFHLFSLFIRKPISSSPFRAHALLWEVAKVA